MNWTRRASRPEHGAERLDELRLGEARHADEQAVAAGQDRDQGQVDDLFLAEDDRVDGVPRAPDRLERRLGDCGRSRRRGR